MSLLFILVIYLGGVACIFYRNRAIWYEECHRVSQKDLGKARNDNFLLNEKARKSVKEYNDLYETVERVLAPLKQSALHALLPSASAYMTSERRMFRFSLTPMRMGEICYDIDLPMAQRFLAEARFRDRMKYELSETWRQEALTVLDRVIEGIVQDPHQQIEITPVTSSGFRDWERGLGPLSSRR